MSNTERNELLIYCSCLKRFSRLSYYFGARLVFSTLCPHRVEKTESSNNQAQIVYNQTHQCLTDKGMNY